MLAIWNLHDEQLPDFDPAISPGLGLPTFVNHIAFGGADLDDLDRRKDRWLANGHDVVRIDHGWGTSIYTNDPSGILVEVCTTTRVVPGADHRAAAGPRAAAPPRVGPPGPPIALF